VRGGEKHLPMDLYNEWKSFKRDDQNEPHEGRNTLVLRDLGGISFTAL